jgi:hypothetical protein
MEYPAFAARSAVVVTTIDEFKRERCGLSKPPRSDFDNSSG